MAVNDWLLIISIVLLNLGPCVILLWESREGK